MHYPVCMKRSKRKTRYKDGSMRGFYNAEEFFVLCVASNNTTIELLFRYTLVVPELFCALKDHTKRDKCLIELSNF